MFTALHCTYLNEGVKAGNAKKHNIIALVRAMEYSQGDVFPRQNSSGSSAVGYINLKKSFPLYCPVILVSVFNYLIRLSFQNKVK